MLATNDLSPAARRYGLLVTGLAPVVPQVLGSIFNIWYNAVVIAPLLVTGPLRRRFALTVIVYNVVVYPLAIWLWLRIIFAARPIFHALVNNASVSPDHLELTRARVINLPWIGTVISSAAWLGCIPVFIISFVTTGEPVHSQLLWHLPISFLVSAFIAVTQTFFLIELASHWALFPVFFRDARPDRIRGSYPPSLRARPDVGNLDRAVSDRLVASANFCSGVAGDASRMVCRLCRHDRRSVRSLFRDSHHTAGCETSR